MFAVLRIYCPFIPHQNLNSYNTTTSSHAQNIKSALWRAQISSSPQYRLLSKTFNEAFSSLKSCHMIRLAIFCRNIYVQLISTCKHTHTFNTWVLVSVRTKPPTTFLTMSYLESVFQHSTGNRAVLQGPALDKDWRIYEQQHNVPRAPSNTYSTKARYLTPEARQGAEAPDRYQRKVWDK